MIDYVPKYYHESDTAVNVIDREADEIIELNEEVADLLDQFFVETATWGLKFWERAVGIKPDENRSLDRRRARVKSRLRAKGVTTKEVIRNIARTHSQDVKVTQDPTNYEFTIEFLNPLDNLDLTEVNSDMNEVKPAHLKTILRVNLLTEGILNLGSTLKIGNTITVYPYQERKIISQGNMVYGIGTVGTTLYSVKPKE